MRIGRILMFGLSWMLAVLMGLWLFNYNSLPAYLIPGSGQFLSVFEESHPVVNLNVSKFDTAEWPVAEAIDFMNNYTGTVLVVTQTCRAKVRCIRIQEDPTMPDSLAGKSSDYGNRIDVNSSARKFNDAIQLGLLVHEMGHAFGIHEHNPKCTSVMFRSVTCPPGKALPLVFTEAEQEILRVN